MTLDRFGYTTGTISVVNGEAVVTGTGTAWGGIDREGHFIVAYPAGSAPVPVGFVAPVDPSGVYQNLELPLRHAYNGTTLSGVEYDIIDGISAMNGATVASVLSRYVAQLQQNLGLSGNTSDVHDFALVPNNSIFWDPLLKRFSQWRNGVLSALPINSIGTPMGAWSSLTEYATGAIVEHGGYLFISNIDENEDNEPDDATPGSSAEWTWLALPAGPGEIYALAFGTNDRPYPGEVLPPHVFVDTVAFPENFTNSRAYAGVAPTAEAILTIRKNGTPVGTITFDAAASTGTFASTGTVTFTPGDVLTILCPTPRDDTFSEIAGTLRAPLV